MRFSRKTQSPSLTFKICFPSVLITVAVLVLWLLLQEKICKGGERRSELQGQRAIWNSLDEWWEPGASGLSGFKHETGSFWVPFQVKRKKSQGCIFYIYSISVLLHNPPSDFWLAALKHCCLNKLTLKQPNKETDEGTVWFIWCLNHKDNSKEQK